MEVEGDDGEQATVTKQSEKITGGVGGKKKKRGRGRPPRQKKDNEDTTGTIESQPLKKRKVDVQRRAVVFVNPLDDVEPWWWPAIVVPKNELDESMPRPDKRLVVVRYFEDCSYSLVDPKEVVPFDEKTRPFLDFKDGRHAFEGEADFQSTNPCIDQHCKVEAEDWPNAANSVSVESNEGADSRLFTNERKPGCITSSGTEGSSKGKDATVQLNRPEKDSGEAKSGTEDERAGMTVKKEPGLTPAFLGTSHTAKEPGQGCLANFTSTLPYGAGESGKIHNAAQGAQIPNVEGHLYSDDTPTQCTLMCSNANTALEQSCQCKSMDVKLCHSASAIHDSAATALCRPSPGYMSTQGKLEVPHTSNNHPAPAVFLATVKCEPRPDANNPDSPPPRKLDPMLLADLEFCHPDIIEAVFAGTETLDPGMAIRDPLAALPKLTPDDLSLSTLLSFHPGSSMCAKSINGRYGELVVESCCQEVEERAFFPASSAKAPAMEQAVSSQSSAQADCGLLPKLDDLLAHSEMPKMVQVNLPKGPLQQERTSAARSHCDSDASIHSQGRLAIIESLTKIEAMIDSAIEFEEHCALEIYTDLRGVMQESQSENGQLESPAACQGDNSCPHVELANHDVASAGAYQTTTKECGQTKMPLKAPALPSVPREADKGQGDGEGNGECFNKPGGRDKAKGGKGTAQKKKWQHNQDNGTITTKEEKSIDRRRRGRAFLQAKGVVRALAYIRTGMVPRGFRWIYWQGHR